MGAAAGVRSLAGVAFGGLQLLDELCGWGAARSQACIGQQGACGLSVSGAEEACALQQGGSVQRMVYACIDTLGDRWERPCG